MTDIEDAKPQDAQDAPCAPPEMAAHEVEPVCVKCRYGAIMTFWHSHMVLGGGYPCEEWWAEYSGTSMELEHLCRRCSRCGYTWATRTADAEPPS